MRRTMSLAERVLKLSRSFRRMFLEQTISDLGEVPAEPAGNEEEVNISARDIADEVYGDAVEDLISALNDKGVEAEREEGSEFAFVVKNGDKSLTFEVQVIESEPIVVAWAEDGRITNSLVPLIGYVGDEGEAIEKLVDDGDSMEEFADYVREVAGIEEEEKEEIEIDVPEEEEIEDIAGEEAEEVEPEWVEMEEEPPRESRKNGTVKGKELVEQDRGEERREIVIGAEVAKGGSKKIADIPVDQLDIEELKGGEEGIEGMKYPDLYKKFMPSPEGTQPDIAGYVTTARDTREEEEK